MVELIKDHLSYTLQGNIVHFISDEDQRPFWSKALNAYLTENHVDLRMRQRYEEQCVEMAKDAIHRRFVDFVSSVHGVKVDLASGPSGYFAPFLDSLFKEDTLIVTDACPAIISAHSSACDKSNFYVFDVDLNKELPFKDECLDIATGNLLNNLDNYALLVREVYRSLKHGGKFAVIEMFFEHGSKTYSRLKEEGRIWASFESFVEYFEKVGFTYIGGDVISTRKGKISKGDLYPLDENECWSDRTLYFQKS